LIMAGHWMTSGLPSTLIEWVGQAVASICVATAIALARRWRLVSRPRLRRELRVDWKQVG
jgi:hypothetical protein